MDEFEGRTYTITHKQMDDWRSYEPEYSEFDKIQDENRELKEFLTNKDQLDEFVTWKKRKEIKEALRR